MQKYGDNKNRHMKSVAEVMYENAGALGINPEEAYVVGLLHDVGYIAVERDSKDNHAQKGAEILERMGMDGDNLNAVRYHGTNCYQMMDEGKIRDISPMLLLLQYADMSVDKYGEKVGFAKRLMDIGRRYGTDSVAHKNAVETVNFLQEVLPFRYEGNKPYIAPVSQEELIDRISGIWTERRKTEQGKEPEELGLYDDSATFPTEMLEEQERF